MKNIPFEKIDSIFVANFINSIRGSGNTTTLAKMALKQPSVILVSRSEDERMIRDLFRYLVNSENRFKKFIKKILKKKLPETPLVISFSNLITRPFEMQRLNYFIHSKKRVLLIDNSVFIDLLYYHNQNQIKLNLKELEPSMMSVMNNFIPKNKKL